MKVLITGATGFVGSHLQRALSSAGHTVATVSRGSGADHDWSQASLRAGIEASDAIVNLAGENIFARRWSARQKELLRKSRVDGTRRLAELAARCDTDTLISASAVGYYGPRGDEPVDEDAAAGDDFLARLCVDWEAATEPAARAGVRVVIVRIGVVLGADGGALARMRAPFRLGLGGPVGAGHQIFPWIHVADLCELLRTLLEDPSLEGVFNASAPGAVSSKELARALGRTLRRPAVLPMPGPVLRALMGEVAGVLLTGQRAVPRRALEAGFRFRHPELDGALRDLLGGPAAAHD